MVGKDEEKKEVMPLWKRKLDEIKNPFINDTVKEVVESFLYLKINNIQKVHGFYKKNHEEKKFFYLMYSMILCDPANAIEICNKEIFKNSQIYPSLTQSNHCINFVFDIGHDD